MVHKGVELLYDSILRVSLDSISATALGGLGLFIVYDAVVFESYILL
jgi:hypothetical protein